MKSRFLITGGSGVLGTELQKYLDCLSPDRGILDVTRPAPEICAELWSQKIRPGVNLRGIIHTAAYTNVSKAEVDKKSVIETNIIGTKNVKNLAEMFDVPMIYISSDYVYEGIAGNYNEEDRTSPLNFYAFSKLAGEAFLDTEKDLIIRTSFKQNDLYPKKYTKAFSDLFTSAGYVDEVSLDIAFAIYSGLRGIYNIGRDRKSIYELAKQRYPDVQKISTSEIPNLVLPKDISMNINKYLEYKNKHIGSFLEFANDKT